MYELNHVKPMRPLKKDLNSTVAVKELQDLGLRYWKEDMDPKSLRAKIGMRFSGDGSPHYAYSRMQAEHSDTYGHCMKPSGAGVNHEFTCGGFHLGLKSHVSIGKLFRSVFLEDLVGTWRKSGPKIDWCIAQGSPINENCTGLTQIARPGPTI